MRTSKELFQASPPFKDFQTMLASPAFEPACNAAIQGLIESLPTAADPAKAWDCYLQIVGARKAFEIFSQLHVKDERERQIKPPDPYGNLSNQKHRP